MVVPFYLAAEAVVSPGTINFGCFNFEPEKESVIKQNKFSVRDKELMRNKSGRTFTLLTPPLVNYFAMNKCVAENAKDFVIFRILRVRYGIIIMMVMMMMMMIILLQALNALPSCLS